MTNQPDRQIDRIRSHSRQLVRELGFMERTLAQTGMSASVVHAILEIGTGRAKTAQHICSALLLEKSTVSRLLASLVSRDLVFETRTLGDARKKHLRLTPTGAELLSEIEKFGRRQVANALQFAGPETAANIEAGLCAYAHSLQQARQNNEAPAQSQALEGPSIQSGYSAGLLGRIVGMLASFCNREVAFGVEFETMVARDMAAFLLRLDRPMNATWQARLDGKTVGGISIDGEELGSGIGQLRWFIVDDVVRGAGLGNQLMEVAMAFIHQQDFTEVHLWTFEGLNAARALYEKHGFVLAEQQSGQKWGAQVLEQKFVWAR